MDDQAHALRCRWRSTTGLQSIAIGGVFGKQPRKVKPMCNLPKADLVRELRACKFYDLDQKDILQKESGTTLTGVQHVPSLLLLHPEQPLGLSIFNTTLSWRVSHSMISRVIFYTCSITINSTTMHSPWQTVQNEYVSACQRTKSAVLT